MGTAAATAGAAGSLGDYGQEEAAGGLSLSNTAASGLHDHATIRERADSSVLCTGLGANLNYLLLQPRHWQGYVLSDVQ